MQRQKHTSREEMVNTLELPDGYLENPRWRHILERLSTRVEDLGLIFEATSDKSSDISVPFSETGIIRRDKSGKKILPIDFTMSQAMELFPANYVDALEKFQTGELNNQESTQTTDIHVESSKFHKHEEEYKNAKLDLINKIKVFIKEEFPIFEPGDESLKKLKEALKTKKAVKKEGSDETAWWLHSDDYSEFMISPPGIVQEQELCTPPPSTYTLIDRKRCERWIDDNVAIKSTVKNKK